MVLPGPREASEQDAGVTGIATLPYRINSHLDRFSSVGVILLYHRVAEGVPDPQLLAVTPAHFAEHLEILAERCTPVHLHNVQRPRGRRPARPTVAVTFDDGYADNLLQAKPLLETQQVPATVFVASGRLGGTEFWWDELAEVLLDTPLLPSVLTCRVHGGERTWNLRDGAEAYRDWNVVRADAGDRGDAYKELCELVGGLDAQEQERVLDQVATWAGVERRARADYRALTPEEVVALAEGGMVDIGGHTVSHPRLSTLPLRAQFSEMREGKTRLESLLGRPVTSFSYPFGGPPDFTLGSMAMARLAGFRLACANYPGRVHRFSPTFALPRFIVRDWPGDEFERHLRAWLHA